MSLSLCLSLMLMPLLAFAETDGGGRLLRIPPREPDQALESFVTRDGFELRLLAAEPLITDPVAMEYDENGRAFVAEMRDYPYTNKETDRPFTEKTTDLPLGRIRLLQDLNGDGVFDQSTVFADELSWPTGLALWRGGVFVAATPDLWYLKDTDGDGRADLRQRVLTGFRKFNIQAVINNLKWGVDHHVYGAGSSNGGTIRPGDAEDREAVVMPTADFRFRPATPALSFEILTGGARFGNTFDDWGHRFICNIRNPVQQIVLPRHYLARNPFAAFPSGVHDAAESGDRVPVRRISQAEPWRAINARRLADDPTSAAPRSESNAVGYMTSASGATIYRGNAFPPQFYGSIFLGEVSGNLVHHQQLSHQGVTYLARRSSSDAEFVASTDNWFRPVNFVNAPDGTLHVLDMYRETIEHPWSIPDDIRSQLDLESGRDRGRIYRLAPRGFVPPPPPKLSAASAAELVDCLSHSAGWYRDTAHRLLFERQDSASVALLRKKLRSGTAQAPHAAVLSQSPDDGGAVGSDSLPDIAAVGRLLALWSLQGLESLASEDLMVALTDTHPEIRAQAVLLAESWLSADPLLAARVLQCAADDDIRVRLQTAFSLGALTSAESRPAAAIRALAEIAVRDGEDPYVRAAILSSAGHSAVAVIEQLIVLTATSEAANSAMLRDLAFVAGARSDADELRTLLQLAGADAQNVANRHRIRQLTAGLGQGLKRAGTSLDEFLAQRRDVPGAAAMTSVLGQAVEDIVTGRIPLAEQAGEQHLQAELMSFVSWETARTVLTPLLAAERSADEQQLAVRALAVHSRDETAQLLLSAWSGLRPAARLDASEALLSRPEWHVPLLTAVESGIVPVFEIPHLRRNLLLRSARADVKNRAVRIFSELLAARQDVVSRYRDALPKLVSDGSRGETVYVRECRNCHSPGNSGQNLGPNLATIRHRAPDEVLLHILDPNREVAPNFVAHVVVTDEGQILTGLIADETPHQLTVRQPTGTEIRLARSKVAEISTTGQSLMPAGFEQRITVQEMADLLEYLLRTPLADQNSGRQTPTD